MKFAKKIFLAYLLIDIKLKMNEGQI